MGDTCVVSKRQASLFPSAHSVLPLPLFAQMEKWAWLHVCACLPACHSLAPDEVENETVYCSQANNGALLLSWKRDVPFAVALHAPVVSLQRFHSLGPSFDLAPAGVI